MPAPLQIRHEQRKRRLSQTVSVLTLACAAAVMTGILLMPELAGALWHLTHNSRVTYGPLSIHVPFSWTANYSSGLLLIKRISRFDKNLDSVTVVGSLTVPDQPGADPEQFRSIEERMMARDGYQLIGERRIRAAGSFGLCFKFGSPTAPSILLANCDFPSLKLRIEFRGGRQYENDLYAMIESAR